MSITFETAKQAVENITAGYNLGNSLEAHGNYFGDDMYEYELQWGEPAIDYRLFEVVKAQGFNTIRLPVTWKHHFDDKGVIDKRWLDRVNEAADAVLALDMYCIINIHHDGGEGSWIISTKEGYEKCGDLFACLWEQIAKRFENYSEKLLFEGVNEPINARREWEANDSDSVSGTLLFNQRFVDTVRAGGGNNKQRNLIVMPYAGSAVKGRLDTFEMPKDSAEDHLILEVHNYDPEGFCWHKAPWTVVRDNWGDEEDYRQLQKLTDDISRFMQKHNVPAILGEFGSMDKNNTEYRAKHAEAMVAAMNKIGVKCFWWDCGEFGIFDRKQCSVKYPLIVKALTKPL